MAAKKKLSEQEQLIERLKENAEGPREVSEITDLDRQRDEQRRPITEGRLADLKKMAT